MSRAILPTTLSFRLLRLIVGEDPIETFDSMSTTAIPTSFGSGVIEDSRTRSA